MAAQCPATCGICEQDAAHTETPSSQDNDSQCLNANGIARIGAACNTCTLHYDDICNEGEDGYCERGTDGADCAAVYQQRIAIANAEQSLLTHSFESMTMLMKFTTYAAAPLSMVCFVVMIWLVCKDDTVPVILDHVFEVFRSRLLALVEAVAFFLVLFSLWFNNVLPCRETFAITPLAVGVSFEETWVNGTSLPPTVAEFRTDDTYLKYILIWLFGARFIVCNLANSQWQSFGKNLTGMSFCLAVLFSLWSLTILS
jgi:hypothetical protein